MYNNKHWIGDVVAGAGIGIGSSKLAVLLFDEIYFMYKQKKKNSLESVFLPSYQNNQICFNWIKKF